VANDFSNIKTTVYQRFVASLSEQAIGFREWSSEVSGDGYSLSRGDLYNMSTFGTSASPSSSDLDTGKADVTRTYYYALQSVATADIDDNPEILGEIANILARKASHKMETLMCAQLAAVDTTAHPENGGNYTASGGGTVYFADVFSTPVSQQNLYTAALSSSALDAVITAALNYKDKNGDNAGLGRGGMRLVVPPALRTTAKELISGTTGVYDGSGIDPRFGDVISGMTVAPYLTDANDWFLIDTAASPIKHWMRKAPSIEVTQSVDGFETHIKAHFTFNPLFEPWEGGLFMGKVA
jgi:hypothetical protein